MKIKLTTFEHTFVIKSSAIPLERCEYWLKRDMGLFAKSMRRCPEWDDMLNAFISVRAIRGVH